MTARRVIYAPGALAQLASLEGYIETKRSPLVAQRFIDALIRYCEGLKKFPHRGTLRDDLQPGLRIVGFRRRATIAFVVDDDTITVFGVFYRGRDYETATRDNNKPAS